MGNREFEAKPMQRSMPIALERGKKYYLEVLHKEGVGEAHISVGWQLPGGTLQRPIPGEHLMPFPKSAKIKGKLYFESLHPNSAHGGEGRGRATASRNAAFTLIELLFVIATIAKDRTGYGETAACSKCHAFAGQGGDIGPDLTQVRTKLGREGIFDSILNPSATIAAEFEPWLIETKDGGSHTGFILGSSDTLTLKDAPPCI